MVLPIVLGTIAAQGAAVASAPTNVSIATSSTGNYDDSFSSVDVAAGAAALTINGSSTSVNVILTIAGGSQPGPYTIDYGTASNANAIIHCYLRADGATSYTMQGGIDSSSFSFGTGCSIAWSGGAFTAQDATGGSGIGFFAITHGTSGRSYTIPDAGDWFKIKVTGSATNSAGTTNATNVVITYTFVDA